MKEEFERNKHLKYYNNWRKIYYQFNNKYSSNPSSFQLNEVCETKYYIKTTLIRKTNTPLLITDNSLSSLLAMSFEQTHILLDSTTFYIKDIRDMTDTPFNTIVFQLDAPPLKSKEHSDTIMKRYFSQKPLNYSIIQYIGKSLGYHHRCPFVSGYEMFVPEKGSANDSTSWYGLHHILYATENKKSNCMHVHFRENHELQLMISARSFNDQVERAAVLSLLQQVVIDELVSLYHYTHTPYFTDEPNIVQRRLKESTFTSVLHPMEKVMYFMSSFRLHEMLEKVLGEGNPYIDEIRKDFMVQLKNKPSSFNE